MYSRLFYGRDDDLDTFNAAHPDQRVFFDGFPGGTPGSPVHGAQFDTAGSVGIADFLSDIALGADDRVYIGAGQSGCKILPDQRPEQQEQPGGNQQEDRNLPDGIAPQET